MTDVATMTMQATGTLVPILANPYSGRGPNRRRVDALIAALRQRGLEPMPVWARAERIALLSNPDLVSRCRCIVAAGGDGSVADVINDMSPAPAPGNSSPVPGCSGGSEASDLPFATLPMGNENLFARQFGFNGRIDRIADAIMRGRTRLIDVGVTNPPLSGRGRLFTLMVSAGFDADVVHRLDQWRKAGEHVKRVNRLTYVPKIMTALRKYDYPLVTIEADGQTISGAHVFIFNIGRYGGNLGIGRHADETDAMLDWIVLQKPGLMQMADYALSVLTMRHLGRPDVPHGRARMIRIASETPVPLQADGDPMGFTPATVEIRPAAVRVIEVVEGRA